MAEEYVYENEGDSTNTMTQEEINEQNRLWELEQKRDEEKAAARAQNVAIDKLKKRRASRILRTLPGREDWISRARGKINTRRQAAARQKKIKNIWRPARATLKQNLNALNLQYSLNPNAEELIPTTNAELQAAAAAAEAGGRHDEVARITQIMDEKAAAKKSIINSKIANARRIAANRLESNYPNNKIALLAEKNAQRATILKIVALDDLLVKNSQELSVADTNEKAERIATRIVNMTTLRDELDKARHSSRLPTPEQNARYQAFVEGIDLGALGNSLYTRLLKNNTSNKAARKIQALYRGVQGRKESKSRRVVRNRLARMKKEQENAAAEAAKQLTPAQVREARLAALAKRGTEG